jgi:prevent-host-death family protein
LLLENWLFKLVCRGEKMKTQDIEVGSFEAKTHLAEILRRAEGGETFVVLRRGKPVARIVPVISEPADDLKRTIEELGRIRAGIEGTVNIRELIEEGRRW